jgi:uncharacterized protein (DUF427 family)
MQVRCPHPRASCGYTAHFRREPTRAHLVHLPMKATWKDAVIAESTDTVMVEGNHYFPPESVKREHLVESTHTSVCPWKGTASYYTLRVGTEENANAAWYYAEPRDVAKQIKGRIAFWKGVRIGP